MSVAGVTKKAVQASRASSQRERREHSAIGGGVPRTRHLATKDAELMAEYRDLDVFSSWLGPSRNRLSSLRTNRKVIGQPILMIVADTRQCWSAAESRACILHPVPGHTTVPSPLANIARRSVLGGLIHECHQLAA